MNEPRYPLHWGGDAENTNSAMAGELRAGLSFGMSGFTYWSHDAGGFVGKAPRDLYRRWLAFGVLTSHTRTHGAPPREPWEYDTAMVTDFRRTVDLKYSLMPYIYRRRRRRQRMAGHAPHAVLKPMIPRRVSKTNHVRFEPARRTFDENPRRVYLPPARGSTTTGRVRRRSLALYYRWRYRSCCS